MPDAPLRRLPFYARRSTLSSNGEMLSITPPVRVLNQHLVVDGEIFPPVVFALHTDDCLLHASPASLLDDQRCESAAPHAARVETFGVALELQAEFGVVAVDDGGARVAAEFALVFIPELRAR